MCYENFESDPHVPPSAFRRFSAWLCQPHMREALEKALEEVPWIENVSYEELSRQCSMAIRQHDYEVSGATR